MKVTKTNIEVASNHPLEEFFEIEEKTTLVPSTVRSTSLATIDQYDIKDGEIETQLQEVYDAAMDAFEVQFKDGQIAEGKYKARAGEVAVQFLNTALTAAQSKSSLKQHKDKVALAVNKASGPKTVNNNLIVADRNEILKRLSEIVPSNKNNE